MQHELNGKTILLAEYEKIVRIECCFSGGNWSGAYHDYHLTNGDLVTCRADEIKSILSSKSGLPEGDWKFFAFTNSITEKQAADLIKKINFFGIEGYSDFGDNGIAFTTAKASFQSWLNANGISGNQAVLIKG